ncbi:hypothetical protein HDU77_008300 [Chytriomyces hyalinus]|nr:hypothetical protein HDU77_008300 [Chytriomyces hyalinus]
MTNSIGFIATNQAFQSDGLSLLLLQVFVILVVCRSISYGFKFVQQPAVIAEVIGGILLGPTALGKWAWFSNTIFPKSSIPTLSILANFGLTLFMLLMGLELDLSVVAKRARVSLIISLTGIVSTFILAAGVSRFFYVYLDGVSELGSFPKFFVFIGVAMSVTALPVLARIINERRLIRTPVGVTVISSAAVDDTLGWTFLAIVIALISSSSPVTGVYIVLTVVAFTIFMFVVVRPLLLKIYNYLSSIHNQNASREAETLSQAMVAVAFLTCLGASFFTTAVGIHSIFGAFLTGLALPRKNHFAEKLTEKLEEFISVIMLPLFFTYSGLNTDIGAINTWTAGAGFILVLSCCIAGKLGMCTLAARFCGLDSRESLAVGILMNTKGLVEIIILNIGLNAKLINQQVFAIMVLLAITTTLMTTPLVTWVYPERYHSPIYGTVKADSDTPLEEHRRYLLCLPNTGSFAPMMKIAHLVSGKDSSLSTSLHVTRFRRLTDRMSSLIAAAQASNLENKDGAARDASVTAFQMFGSLRGLSIVPHLVLAQVKDYAKDVSKLAFEIQADMTIVPWNVRPKQLDGSAVAEKKADSKTKDLFVSWFGKEVVEGIQTTPVVEAEDDGWSSNNMSVSESVAAELALQLVRKSKIPVAVLVDRSANSLSFAQSDTSIDKPIIIVPFFGGPDDRLAVLVAMRLATLPGSQVGILHIRTLEKAGDGEDTTTKAAGETSNSTLRRRIFSKTPSSGTNGTIETDAPILPAGYKVAAVDAEDAKFLEMILNFAGPVTGLQAPAPVAHAASSSDQEITAEVSPQGDSLTELMPVPANSIPFRRVHTSNGPIPESAEVVTGDHTVESIDVVTSPRRPSVIGMIANAVPFRKVNTTGSAHANIEAAVDTSFKPRVHLTEIAAPDPLAAFLETMKAPESGIFSLIIAGHYGAQWIGAHGGASDANAERSGSTVQYWNEHATVLGGSSSDSAFPAVTPLSPDEKVLGPTGAAIVASGVGRSSLLVVRKISVGPL